MCSVINFWKVAFPNNTVLDFTDQKNLSNDEKCRF